VSSKILPLKVVFSIVEMSEVAEARGVLAEAEAVGLVLALGETEPVGVGVASGVAVTSGLGVAETSGPGVETGVAVAVGEAEGLAGVVGVSLGVQATSIEKLNARGRDDLSALTMV
jgi:hypothetical protein